VLNAEALAASDPDALLREARCELQACEDLGLHVPNLRSQHATQVRGPCLALTRIVSVLLSSGAQGRAGKYSHPVMNGM